jgi:phage gp29-like protein
MKMSGDVDVERRVRRNLRRATAQSKHLLEKVQLVPPFARLVLTASQTNSCFARHEFDTVRKPDVASLQGEAYRVVTRACGKQNVY